MFKVSNTLKGAPQETVVVKTGTGQGDCGYGEMFVEGKTYLIYAGQYDANTLWLWRVVTDSDVQEDIGILQQPANVGEQVGMPRTGESQRPFLVTLILMATFTLATGLVLRRKA